MTQISQNISKFMTMIKFSHTIFALPFALTSMVLASLNNHGKIFPGWWDVTLIVIACYAARTAAMTYNRIVDRDVDAENPRTQNRELVTGAFRLGLAIWIMFGHCLLFIVCAGLLNTFALVLSPFCLFVLLGYSHTKRFTWLSHFALGAALGLAPIGAWIAIDGVNVFNHAEPFLLGLTVLLWVAGFDMIYACQDYEFDVEAGLFSIAQRFGLSGAMLAASIMHLLAMLGFFAFILVADLGWFSLVGVNAAALLLVFEHRLISPKDRSKINVAFFTMNGLISIIFFLCVVLDAAI